MTAFRTLSLVAVLATATLGGCSMFGSDDDHHSRDDSRSSDRYDDTRRSSDRYDSRDVRDIRGVPRNARLVDETRGGTLSWSARDSGHVYVADLSKGAVIWDKKVRDGDRVSVDPDKNRISLNGHDDTDMDLKSNNRFGLFFDPSR